MAKPKRPSLPFIPTAEQRGVVKVLSATGIPIEHIASLVINPETGKGISKNTLKKYLKPELEGGHMQVKAYVINKLFSLISNDNPAAIFFYLKTQCGWRERDRGDEGVGLGVGGGSGMKDITPTQIPDNPVEASRIYQRFING